MGSNSDLPLLDFDDVFPSVHDEVTRKTPVPPELLGSQPSRKIESSRVSMPAMPVVEKRVIPAARVTTVMPKPLSDRLVPLTRPETKSIQLPAAPAAQIPAWHWCWKDLILAGMLVSFGLRFILAATGWHLR